MNKYLVYEYLKTYLSGDQFYVRCLLDAYLITLYPDYNNKATPIKLKTYYDNNPSFHTKVTFNDEKLKNYSLNFPHLRLIKN